MLSLRDLNEGMGDCGSIPLVCPLCRGELELGKAYEVKVEMDARVPIIPK